MDSAGEDTRDELALNVANLNTETLSVKLGMLKTS